MPYDTRNCLYKCTLLTQTTIAIAFSIAYTAASWLSIATVNYEIFRKCETWQQPLPENYTTLEYLSEANKNALCTLSPVIIDSAIGYAEVKLYGRLMWGTFELPSLVTIDHGGLMWAFDQMVGKLFPEMAEHIGGHNTATIAGHIATQENHPV